MNKKESTMLGWKIISNGDWYYLRGNVLNDPRFKDNTYVNTSMLERVDFVKGIAETANTIYRLVD